MREIEKYLDSVLRASKLAPRDAERVRNELADHLYQAIQSEGYDCRNQKETAREIIKEFGDPAELGRMIASARGRVRTYLKKNAAILSISAAAVGLICLTGVIAGL